MKTLLDTAGSQEMLERLGRITPQSPRQWGKMDVAQMIAHCSNGLEMAMGTLKTKPTLTGKLIGRFFKAIYINEKPFSKGDPTSNELRVVDQRDFDKEKQRLERLITQFAAGGYEKITRDPHPFFGSLNQQAWARGMYKHPDHHFRQFGA